jgi:flagellar M-ring protein FliF
MIDALKRVKNQLNEFYQGLTKSQKIKIAISGLLIIVSMAALFYVISKPEYITLYKNLEPKEAGEITAKLNELSIPWKNDETGTKILVPKEYKNKAQMELAVEGLPTERFSYDDIFNSSSITTTNEERQKKYLIAQMNDLAKTIEEIDGIEKATVNLSVAEDSKFLLKDQESKASVFVELKPGKAISAEQVNGIVMLVANAVKDLKPENVSVIDNKGLLLNKKSDDGTFHASTQLNLQQQVQEELKSSLTQFLSTVYGPNNIAVMANVKLDFDSEVTDVQEFSPPIEGEDNGLVRSMTDLKEQVINQPQGNVPGSPENVGNVPEYQEAEGEVSRYDKANQTINYELNEIKKKIVKAQGQVKDITVAVLINKKALVDQELTEDHKEEIMDLVSACTGLDTKVVEVMATDFDTSKAEGFGTEKGKKGLLGDTPMWLIGVLIALALGGAGYGMYRFRQRRRETQESLEGTMTIPDETIEEIELEVSDKSNHKRQIEKFIDNNPEAAAQLLRTWLDED